MLYRSLLVVLALIGSDTRTDVVAGERLFGQPSARTGLSDAQCGPTCDCGGRSWTAPTYTADELVELRTWTLLDDAPLLTSNPYDHAPPRRSASDEVCGFVRGEEGTKTYTLRTFASAADAEMAGARVTHTGACGACSTLADLAVYLGEPELADPVRACGIEHLGSPRAHLACLEDIGFTPACAQIWYYNTIHTRNACLGVCMVSWGAPHNAPNGALNACLQCDEDESGAVFKAVAGRTRRNTGMASSICRPCSEVFPIEHRYE